MGNSCSFGHGRKNSDTISEKSDESNHHPKSAEAKRPHESDTGKGNHGGTYSSDVTGEKTPQVTSAVEQGIRTGVAPKALQEVTNVCGDSTSSPSPVVKEFSTKIEDISDNGLPPKLQEMESSQVLLLKGKLDSDKCRSKNKKIVLFVLSADCNESQQERSEVSDNLLKKLRLKFSKQDFEIHLVDLNFENKSSLKTRFDFKLQKWEMKKQSECSYVIPILVLSNTFGQQLLPYSINTADFEEILSMLENDKCKKLMNNLYQKKMNENVYQMRSDVSSCDTENKDLTKEVSNVLSQEKKLKYLTTPLEDILNDILQRQDLLKNFIWLNRTGTLPFNTDADIQKKYSNIIQELKKHVSEKNILKHTPKPSDNQDPTNLIQQISAQLLTALTNQISSIIQDYSQTTLIKPCLGITSKLFYKIENQIPELIPESEELERIMEYLKNDSRKYPLVIYGPSYCGKSSLLKKVYKKCLDGDCPKFAEGIIVCRYIEFMESKNIVGLLEELADHCKVLADGEETTCKFEIDEYSKLFNSSLKIIKKPLVIILDGLDGYHPVDVSWIPERLPSNVKFLISITYNSADENVFYKALKDKIDEKCFMKMEKHSLAGVKDEEYLNVQMDELSNADDYYKFISEKLSSFITKAANELTEFSVIRILSLLVAANAGLLESEIIDLLIGCEKLKGTQNQSFNSASVFWTKFYKRMEPFFLHKRDHISFKNLLLKLIIECKFKDDVALAHQILFDYFSGDIYKTDNATYSYDRFITRKHVELPYHHFHIAGVEKFISSDYLTNTEWIYSKLQSSQTSDLLDDINLVESSSRPVHVKVLQQFLINNKKCLDYDARQFYSLLNMFFEKQQDYSKMNGKSDQKLEAKRRFSNDIVQNWFDISKNPPTHTLVVQNIDDLKCDENKSVVVFNSLQRLGNGDTGYVTSLSTDREEICVWDISRCKRVRTLNGITQPLSLCPVDSERCIVLCGRELRLFNLDLGSSLVKLKGVMNQKMPYYGLHDNEHVVCLSRNRMYVNLLNLESGDCVTTFKAGEDRFLNSLLVSGDGRILVCGDETQKPFPLLVWHLTSRKLLYDLRIPHHDFVTSLAAITYEGNYVCVVCRETTEPSPNFIVVYDLQSGTLFKKWKPQCDTVALEISSADGSVVSGLQDARILIWDLITGNCRHTLVGHTAPVNSLRLDPSGGILLSYDSECRDRSIRLWDLNNGSMLAVFTPRSKITSCEIIQKGHYIALALEDHKNIIVLKLKKPENQNQESKTEEVKETLAQFYGLPENDGKVFNLKEGV